MSNDRLDLTAPTEQARITVLLIHAYQLVAEALAAALRVEPDLDVVTVKSDPELVADCIHQDRSVVVVLDSAAGGMQLTAALRAEHPELKIIMLVPSLGPDSLLACVRAGAVGWLAWGSALAELAPAIRRAQAGEVLFAAHLLADLIQRPSYAGRLLERQGLRQLLGPREVELLQALATGMSIEQAAGRLSITIHTARTHLKNAMAKLQVHSRLEAVAAALNRGLISMPEPPGTPELPP
jgi:DNA-binding NarL/FixJ family response regulator